MSDEIIPVDEVAARLSVNRKTLYAAIQRNEVPGVIRIGRRIMINWTVYSKAIGRQTDGSAKAAVDGQGG